MSKKKIASFYGFDENKCSCGHGRKKPNTGGCFIETIMSSVDLSQAEHLE